MRVRKGFLLGVLFLLAIIAAVLVPLVRAKMQYSALEDCIIEEWKLSGDPGRTAEVMRENVWQCVETLGLARYISKDRVFVRKESNQARIEVEYDRDLWLLGYRYRWHFHIDTRSCVAEGSLIATPVGPRRVEDLVPGDLVLSVGPGGAPDAARVSELRAHRVRALLRLVLDNGAELRVTSEHPLLCGERWTRGGDLIVGSLLHGARASVRVLSVVPLRGDFRVYDLRVEPTHTFFVDGVLVHNKTF